MYVQELIKYLLNSESKGIQVSKRNGILSSTWLVYKKGEDFYYFDINQKIEFIECFRYTEAELIEELKGHWFEIEMEVP